MVKDTDLIETEIENIYQALRFKIIHLNNIWQNYIVLFPLDSSNIAVLEKSGKSFFGYLKRSIFDDIVLIIAKLLDKKEYFKINSDSKKTLSFEQFNEILVCNNKIKQEDIKKKFSKLKDEYENFSKWRNRRISHSDLNYELGKDQLPELHFEKCQAMIMHINEYFKLYDKLLNKVETSYENSLFDGDTLLLIKKLLFSCEFYDFEHILKNVTLSDIFDNFLPYDDCKNMTIQQLFLAIRHKIDMSLL
jgi:hypothetical protein